jgi:hypothetical protein|nr:MAG TPA: hypothetical protein [Caudoviricetes sp.]
MVSRVVGMSTLCVLFLRLLIIGKIGILDRWRKNMKDYQDIMLEKIVHQNEIIIKKLDELRQIEEMKNAAYINSQRVTHPFNHRSEDVNPQSRDKAYDHLNSWCP